MSKEKDYITLKWGTLKSWKITSRRGQKVLDAYYKEGCSLGAATQHDTPKQKRIICKLIDLVPGRIYLDWDDKYVSKETAKRYVLKYDLP